MAQEFARDTNTNPVIQAPQTNSASKGLNNIAQTLGMIAGRTMEKSIDYASAASKSNLIQTHSMIQDVEANSKLEMFKSPNHSAEIARNAHASIEQIKHNSKLNGGDRSQLNSSADSMVRDLNLSASEKEITLGRMQAKYASLTAFGNTSQTIIQKLFRDPEQADQFIEDQYESIRGQVASGVLTPTEALSLHKQMQGQVEVAQKVAQKMHEGKLTASHASALHAMDTAKIPMSNAGLPIDHHTAMNSGHYSSQLTLKDIKSQYASGAIPSVDDVIKLKPNEVDGVINYGEGAILATGDINSTKDFNVLRKRVDHLKAKPEKTLQEEGYLHRLSTFMNDTEQPGFYTSYVTGTPEGARMWRDHNDRQVTINDSVPFGDAEQQAHTKYQQSVDNLNDLISKTNAVGIGMNYPDDRRQPIPEQYAKPIRDSFASGADVRGAINNMRMLSTENRVYAMNLFPKEPRKQLTVYAAGLLGNGGDERFVTQLMLSQQDNILSQGEIGKTAQEHYAQLDTSKDGYSDKKLEAKISPQLSQFSPWLRMQPGGGAVVNGQVEAAKRYVKFMAAQNNDYKMEHVDSYIKDFTTNMEAAYKVEQGSNYSLDKNNVPLEKNEMQVLTGHALNVAKQKVIEAVGPANARNVWDTSAPSLVSSPGGRIMVVDSNGLVIPDKNGNPAYSEIYNESVWRSAELDESGVNKQGFVSKFMNKFEGKESIPGVPDAGVTKLPSFIRRDSIPRPTEQGNIDLDKREKVWNQDGGYSTVRTMTIEEDGKTILLPTIVNDKEVSEDAAVANFHRTGDHLGKFNTQKQADEYDQAMHKRMKWLGENAWKGESKVTKQEGKEEAKPESKTVKPGDDIKSLTDEFIKSKAFKDSDLSEAEVRNKISESIKPDDTKADIKSKLDTFMKSKEFKASGVEGEGDEAKIYNLIKETEGVGSNIQGDVPTRGHGVTQAAVNEILPRKKLAELTEKQVEFVGKAYAAKIYKGLIKDVPELKDAPNEVKATLTKDQYNLPPGVVASHIKPFVKKGDWMGAAKSLLSTATAPKVIKDKKGKVIERHPQHTFKGLAKSRAKSYNVIAELEGQPLIKFVEQTAKALKYIDENGKVVFSFAGKGRHPDSDLGILNILAK